MAHPSPLETETEAAPHTPTLADIALAEAEGPYTWESCDNSEYFATPTQNMESVSDSEGSAFESWKRRRSVEQDVSVEQDGVPVEDSEQDVSVESAPIGSFMYLLGGMAPVHPVHTVTEPNPLKSKLQGA